MPGRRHAQQVEHGRHQVDDAHRVGDAPRRRPLERRADDERHARHGFVDEEPVRGPRRARRGSRRGRPSRRPRCAPAARVRSRNCDDAADLRVREGDLAAVGIAGVLRLERLGRRVRRVRVVEVDPREEAAGPWPTSIHGSAVSTTSLPGRWMSPGDLPPRCTAGIEVVEVGVEALVDAPLAVEHVGRDEPAGPVARVPCSTSASVTCSGPRKNPPLSRTPCSGGNLPVKMLECAGSVSGAVVIACSKSTPSRRQRVERRGWHRSSRRRRRGGPRASCRA